MKFVFDDELLERTMDTRGVTANDENANYEQCGKSSRKSNSRCRVLGKNKAFFDTSEILECYNLPSFKSDTSGLVYTCIHCNETCYDCVTIKDHLGAVHCDFQYYCQYCGEFFSTYWQLKRHKKRYTYNCGSCYYSSNNYSQYRNHKRRAHNVELKPKFHRKSRYSKAYECEICGYQVLLQHIYKNHMKTIHKQDVEVE